MKSRNLAYKVLFDIEKNENYSNMAINKYFKDCDLDSRDRGFATEIIYGVVENKIYLGGSKNDPEKTSLQMQRMRQYRRSADGGRWNAGVLWQRDGPSD